MQFLLALKTAGRDCRIVTPKSKKFCTYYPHQLRELDA